MRARTAAVLLFSAAAGLWFGQCFAPTYSDCAFRCGPQAPTCPAEYECRADGYCHLPGNTGVCVLPVAGDLGAAADGGPDLAIGGDASTVPPDLAASD